MAFLGLAGTGLLALVLEVNPRISVQDEQLASAKIVSLPRMISLRLVNLRLHKSVHSICGQRLRGLQELTLVETGLTLFYLFKTTAMSSLRVLFIQDDMIQHVKDTSAREQLKIDLVRLEASLADAAKTILSLPVLSEVIGNASVMHVGMKGLVPLWRAPRHITDNAPFFSAFKRPIMVAYKRQMMLRR